MMDIHDKRARADLFRDRLATAMQNAGSNQSALARQIGTDRSTISQLLRPATTRLPNAHLVGSCAQALGVSCDWLLGLSDRPELAADLLAGAMRQSHAERATADEQIYEWHRESEGFKIRHVPALLPDMLKTRAVLEWEYEPHLGRTIEQAIGAAHDRLEWLKGGRSDYEIAMPLYELDSFAAGTGYYATLPKEVRSRQIYDLIALSQALYPRLRICLFDARRLYSAPLTVYGPLLAVLYIGQSFLAFRDTERVRSFTDHCDHLVKEAEVSARDFPDHLQSLARTYDL